MRDLSTATGARTPRADRSSPALVRLFVVPHAGGGAAHYRGWSDWLPETVRLEVLELPGHATRIREPPATEWRPLVADLAAIVRSRAAGGYVLAGHSLGALLAYEVARTMEREAAPPGLLIVSGRNAPAAGLSHRPIHPLPDAEFLAALDRLGGTPAAVLGRPDLIRAYLPVLRADLRLAETYVRAPGPPLSAPVAAFAGRQDRLTDGPGLAGWIRETTGTFDLTVLEGGHFFHDRPAFAEAVRARLARLGERGGPRFAMDSGTDSETDHGPGLASPYSSLVDFTM